MTARHLTPHRISLLALLMFGFLAVAAGNAGQQELSLFFGAVAGIAIVAGWMLRSVR